MFRQTFAIIRRFTQRCTCWWWQRFVETHVGVSNTRCMCIYQMRLLVSLSLSQDARSIWHKFCIADKSKQTPAKVCHYNLWCGLGKRISVSKRKKSLPLPGFERRRSILSIRQYTDSSVQVFITNNHKPWFINRCFIRKRNLANNTGRRRKGEGQHWLWVLGTLFYQRVKF
jgi:hypothetical protein